MSSSEETDDFKWADYTDRHARRLAHKQSIRELNTIYNKIIEDRANTARDDSQMDCNSSTDTEDIIPLQYPNNIHNIDEQVLVEDCESIIEAIFNENNSTSEDSEIQLQNDYVSIYIESHKR